MKPFIPFAKLTRLQRRYVRIKTAYNFYRNYFGDIPDSCWAGKDLGMLAYNADIRHVGQMWKKYETRMHNMHKSLDGVKAMALFKASRVPAARPIRYLRKKTEVQTMNKEKQGVKVKHLIWRLRKLNLAGLSYLQRKYIHTVVAYNHYNTALRTLWHRLPKKHNQRLDSGKISEEEMKYFEYLVGLVDHYMSIMITIEFDHGLNIKDTMDLFSLNNRNKRLRFFVLFEEGDYEKNGGEVGKTWLQINISK